MSTNKQRREAERVRLQRQLEQRREREATHKQFATIASIVGALVLVAAIVVVVAVATSGKDKPAASKSGAVTSPSTSASDANSAAQPSAPPSAQAQPPTPADPVLTKACAGPGKGSKSSYQSVTVTGATDLKKAPKLTSMSAATPKSLLCQDLVVGKGPAAKPSSTANVRYVGVLYKDGTVFDSSWMRGMAPTPFPLSKVVSGFRLGIGGSGKVTPMHVGGRRLLILPPSLGYGPQANGPIPANSTLVFVVDLTSLGS